VTDPLAPHKPVTVTNQSATITGTPTTTPTATPSTLAHHELGWAQTTNICTGGTSPRPASKRRSPSHSTRREKGPARLTLTLEDIPANTPVKLNLTGNGLPSSLTLTLDPGFQVTRDFTVPASTGTVSWTSQLVSIGGQPPPSSGAHASAFANCPTTT
jgi:hypothetical protein